MKTKLFIAVFGILVKRFLQRGQFFFGDYRFRLENRPVVVYHIIIFGFYAVDFLTLQ